MRYIVDVGQGTGNQIIFVSLYRAPEMADIITRCWCQATGKSYSRLLHFHRCAPTINSCIILAQYLIHSHRVFSFPGLRCGFQTSQPGLSSRGNFFSAYSLPGRLKQPETEPLWHLTGRTGTGQENSASAGPLQWSNLALPQIKSASLTSTDVLVKSVYSIITGNAWR